MVRNLKWLLPAAASLVLAAVVVVQSRQAASMPPSAPRFEVKTQSGPLDFDQTEYRRQNGTWRLTVESVERPYV